MFNGSLVDGCFQNKDFAHVCVVMDEFRIDCLIEKNFVMLSLLSSNYFYDWFLSFIIIIYKIYIFDVEFY